MAATEIEERGINVIRGLAMDAVQKAGNGHPGTAMALAPLAHVLWTRIMKYDASEPDWPDRDRFVLSNGHASIILYTMLYLTGYGVELDDLRVAPPVAVAHSGPPRVPACSRASRSPPARSGRASATAWASASPRATSASRFGPDVVDHHIFVVAGDGCLQEGVSHEAASLAGHLGIGRLVYIYDDNHITIDGPTELSYSDDVPKRFAGYGWHVVELGEVANDLDAIEGGIRAGMAEAERPSIVILRSHIGYPSPKYTDTAFAHGNALGADEVAAVKDILGLPQDDFYSPDDVLAYYREAGRAGAPIGSTGSVAASRSRSASRVSTKSSTRASSSAGSRVGRRSSRRGTRATRSPRVARRARSSKRSSTSCRRSSPVAPT